MFLQHNYTDSEKHLRVSGKPSPPPCILQSLRAVEISLQSASIQGPQGLSATGRHRKRVYHRIYAADRQDVNMQGSQPHAIACYG